MDKETKARYTENLKWAQNYWKRKSEQLKITDWKFGINHMKTSLAITHYNKKQVFVSSYLLRGKTCSKEKIRNTILHEIAHIFAGYKNGHNAKWREIALKIGCNGEICDTMSYIPGNYLMFCPKGCIKREYFRKPKIEGKLCSKCSSKVKLKSLKS